MKDTIPRLQKLVPHMREQIIGLLRQGTTFEDARLRYSATVDRLVAEGLGRGTVSRVGDRDKYWSSTGEVLDEAMRLGFVERELLPSARRYLDAHRGRNYALTLLGERAAELAEKDLPVFCDQLARAIYEAHGYFRKLLEVLESRPLTCPEVTEGEVEEARRVEKRTSYWINYAVERLTTETSDSARDTEFIRNTVVSFVRRRFGRKPNKEPTSKEIAKALNESFAEASIGLRGLQIGATDLNILKSWGTQLRLLDESRYVPDFVGQNVIWLAADIQADSNLRIERRVLEDHMDVVAEAVVAAYRNQASSTDSKLSAPYLPIYNVRAEAAFRCKVTRALVDFVIERLAGGLLPEVGVQVWLHLGTSRQPSSEPVYRRGGSRRYEMTLQSNSNERRMA